jgi:hypothetical protein
MDYAGAMNEVKSQDYSHSLQRNYLIHIKQIQ